MFIFKHILLIILSFLYGIAIMILQETEFANRKFIKNIVDLILATACLTSISFMSHVFEINHYIELLCYLIMIVISILLPIFIQNKNRKK